MAGTNLSAAVSTTLWIRETQPVPAGSQGQGLAISAACTGTPPTTAGIFATGCIMLQTDAAGNGLSVNVGTSAAPVWQEQDMATVVNGATIATTGNSDVYFIAPQAGKVSSIDFSGVDALATSDTNYITWTVTNLGQAGAGTAAMLAATDANTTKATGGTALSANTKRALTLTSTAADLAVAAGDRIRIRAAATGTLANTVTFPGYVIRF